jgi:prolyl oligopeptidase
MQNKAEPLWMFSATVSHDGSLVFVSVGDSCDPTNRVYWFTIEAFQAFKNKEVGALEYHTLVDSFDAGFNYVDSEGRKVLFQTNLDAPKYRLVSIDLDAKAPLDEMIEVVPESEHVLECTRVVHQNLLILNYVEHCKEVCVRVCVCVCVFVYLHSTYIYIYVITLYHTQHTQVLKVFNVDGKFQRNLDMPANVSIGGLSTRKQDSSLFFKYTSYTEPGTIIAYDLATSTSAVLQQV